jgi:DNA helicase-2/ATP-dependent DNA helicase PcrA
VEGLSKFQNIEELFNSVKNFCDESIENAEQDGVDAKITLSDYLENIVLLSAVEREESSENTEDTNNKITLMTVHSSKGLEFPYVYIAGMEENLFPSGSDILPSEIEEERRLFYVALTRAKKAISLSFAANRMRWGKSESNSVSRFVREIDPQYIDGDVSMKSSRAESNVAMVRAFTSQFSRPTRTPLPSRPATNTTVTSAKISSEVASISSLKVGQRVHHDRFGLGVILAFEDSGANQKAIVEFSTGEKRTLLLKYAKLHSVE